MQRITLTRVGAAFTLLAGLTLSGCQDHLPLLAPGVNIQPTGSPDVPFGSMMKPQMRAVIEELQRLNPVPLYTLTPQGPHEANV